jgi:hypothetical protein
LAFSVLKWRKVAPAPASRMARIVKDFHMAVDRSWELRGEGRWVALNTDISDQFLAISAAELNPKHAWAEFF